MTSDCMCYYAVSYQILLGEDRVTRRKAKGAALTRVEEMVS